MIFFSFAAADTEVCDFESVGEMKSACNLLMGRFSALFFRILEDIILSRQSPLSRTLKRSEITAIVISEEDGLLPYLPVSTILRTQYLRSPSSQRGMTDGGLYICGHQQRVRIAHPVFV